MNDKEDSIDRGFVRIKEGLVHYRLRHGRERSDDQLPLYMVHAGPVSSASLAPLITEMPPSRRIIAPDTLGYGDSAPPAPDAPDVKYFADSVVRILDALEIDRVDYYGTHTGAHIGCELAIAHPDRVRRLVFDGITLFDDETRKDLLENYAPPKVPDDNGLQFPWAFQFLRDQFLFFPHYRKDAEHSLSKGMAPPQLLHDYVLDVLKALRTYHKGYNAVFRHNTAERLSLIKEPILFMAHAEDPMRHFADEAATLALNGKTAQVDSTDGHARQVELIERFLAE